MNIHRKTTMIEEGKLANTDRQAAPKVASLRKIALAAGILYLLTFVSIPTAFLYAPISDPNYIVSPGPDTGIILGAVLEIIVALAGIGTAVALYPVVKRQNEALALGFVASRVLEAMHHLRGCRLPPGAGDLAAGWSRSRCVGHWQGTGRPVYLVQTRTKPYAGC